MKKVLIISPHFPPTNAADMHRVRMSLPYFKDFNWAPEVVAVNAAYSDSVKDPLLIQSIPVDTVIYYVKALKKKWTSVFGLGSLALRSMPYYFKTVNRLLKTGSYDLVYFSTTQFPLCILGTYWKKRFGIKYVIDMQDPWHSNYYQDKPEEERPAKYWFSYRMHKFLEPIAMKKVDGLISVSEEYIKLLDLRYPHLRDVPASVITFGFLEKDFEIAAENKENLAPVYIKKKGLIDIVYVGRGGYDMQDAAELLFTAFKRGLSAEPELFNKLRLHFIGTSYAPQGQGIPTFMPLAEKHGITEYVQEQTARVGFYNALSALQSADALFIPGSDDPKYTASKIYPYIAIKKPLLAVFNLSGSAAKIIKDCNAGVVANLADQNSALNHIFDFLRDLAKGNQIIPEISSEKFNDFMAKSMTGKQCALFNQVISVESPD